MDHHIPIVIGITGHRDIAPGSAEGLYERVRALLADLRARYPASPVTVLSPLAAGADALCARAALEAGCTLIAPLPLEPGDYRADFTPAEATAFDALCEEAADCFVVPDIEPRPAAPIRGWHYRQAGLYVPAHCHLLLALWDGEVQGNEDSCGTWETVHQMLGGSLEWLTASAPAGKCGPVVQLVTPRGERGAPPEGYPLRLHQPGRESLPCQELPALELFDDIEAFNREVDAEKPRIEREEAGCLAGCVDPALLPGLDGGQRELLGAFAAADTLAIHHQQKRLWVVQALSAVALLLVLSFLFYDEAASFAALIVYGLLLIPAAGFAPRPIPPRLAEAERCWVEGQLAYHRRSLAKKGRKNRLNENAGRGLLLAAVLFYIVVLLMEIFAPALMELPLLTLPGFGFALSGLTKIILGALFAGAAFLSNYYGKLDLPRQMGSDEKMAALFELADDGLERHRSDEEAQREILLELARAHAEESISWFVYQSGNAPEFIID